MSNYRSDSLLSLIPALIKAQSKFDIAEKTMKKGPGQDKGPKWKYADWPTMVEASRKALESNGLCVTQRLLESPEGTILSSILFHISGEYIESQIKLLMTASSNCQAVGSCITYFKRYAYAALIGLVTADEDDDGTKSVEDQKELNKKRVEEEVRKPEHKSLYISDKELTIIEHHLEDHPELIQSVFTNYGIDTLAKIPAVAYPKLIKRIKEIKSATDIK